MKRLSLYFVPFLSVVLSLLLSAVVVFAETPHDEGVLILPHVEANDDFFTGLSLLNIGDKTSEVRLIAYNESGHVIETNEAFSLPPGNRYLNSIVDIFGYDTAVEMSWIRLEYTGEISGFALLGNDGQLARISLQRKGKAMLILPYTITGSGLFTQVYILNPGPDFAALTFIAYDGNGKLLKKVSHKRPLSPGQKVVGTVTDLFGREVSEEISWMKVESDRELIGLALVGASERLFTIPMD